MTTTAHEDQFTDAPEPVRQPYDTGSILRRNVADLEIALKQQTERAEAAEAELLAVREDNHSMMVEIDGLRKELAKVREQEPVAIYDGVEMSRYTLRWTNGPIPVDTNLYINPVPAPAVPERLMYVLKDLKARAYKQLDHGKGRSISIDSNTAIDIADALLQSAPAVPENFRAAAVAYLESIDRFNTLNDTVGGGWSTKKAGTHQEIVLAANEMHGRRKLLEAMLQSTTQSEVRHD